MNEKKCVTYREFGDELSFVNMIVGAADAYMSGSSVSQTVKHVLEATCRKLELNRFRV